jgi:hypothetical protein
MKCPHCGGLIISEPGIGGQPDRLKCVMCGRDPEAVGRQQMAIGNMGKSCAYPIPPEKEGDDDMKNPKVTRDEKGNVIVPEGFVYQPEYKRNGIVIPEHFRKWGYKKKSAGGRQAAAGRDYKTEYKRRKNNNAVGNADMRSLQSPITKATPEEIIKALRKGVAQEMIEDLRKKYEL